MLLTFTLCVAWSVLLVVVIFLTVCTVLQTSAKECALFYHTSVERVLTFPRSRQTGVTVLLVRSVARRSAVEVTLAISCYRRPQWRTTLCVPLTTTLILNIPPLGNLIFLLKQLIWLRQRCSGQCAHHDEPLGTCDYVQSNLSKRMQSLWICGDISSLFLEFRFETKGLWCDSTWNRFPIRKSAKL